MFQKLLLPIELKRPVEDIKNRVSFLKSLGATDIVLLNVATPGLENSKHTKRLMDRMGSALRELEVNVTLTIKTGHVSVQIVEASNEYKTDMIHIPWRKNQLLHRLILGSTTKEVVRLSEKPVFIDKDGPHRLYLKGITNILYATDFNEASERALPYVAHLGTAERNLKLFHVGHRSADPYSEKRRIKATYTRLDELKQQFESGYAQVETEATIGTPHKHILYKSKKDDVDLIITGRFNDRPLRQIIGSNTQEVADRAGCSMLVIP